VNDKCRSKKNCKISYENGELKVVCEPREPEPKPKGKNCRLVYDNGEVTYVCDGTGDPNTKSKNGVTCKTIYENGKIGIVCEEQNPDTNQQNDCQSFDLSQGQLRCGKGGKDGKLGMMAAKIGECAKPGPPGKPGKSKKSKPISRINLPPPSSPPSSPPPSAPYVEALKNPNR